jgi:hypothetical protein
MLGHRGTVGGDQNFLVHGESSLTSRYLRIVVLVFILGGSDMLDLYQGCVRFPVREKIGCHKIPCDKKIQHLLCENIQKQVEIIVAVLSLRTHSTTAPFPRFTYGNHADTLAQYPYRQVLTAAQHSTAYSDIYIMEKQGL